MKIDLTKLENYKDGMHIKDKLKGLTTLNFGLNQTIIMP